MEITKRFTQDELQILYGAKIVPEGTPEAQIRLFGSICKAKGLDPFRKEIYLTSYKDRKTGQPNYAVITGIDGFRKLANQTGLYAGIDEIKFNLDSSGKFKTHFELKQANELPISATCTIYKIVAGLRVPFTHTVLYKEFAPSENALEYSKYKTMPFQMIAKTAEAFALRKAFSDELSGLHEESEITAFQDAQVQDAVTIATMEEKEPEQWILELKSELKNKKTIEELSGFFKSNPQWKADDDVISLFTERKREIQDEN